MLGVLLGALLTGQLADLFGRKKTLVAVASGMMFIQAAVSLSISWQIYIFIRFLACVCLGEYERPELVPSFRPGGTASVGKLYSKTATSLETRLDTSPLDLKPG
jgi:MFS family permease